MLTVKTHQQNALDALAAYCRLCVATGDPDLAFHQITRQHFHQGIPYRAASELPGLPYICIRIPTGGGETLVASHSAGILALEFLQTEQPRMLWLTPSNTIRSQTLATLRVRRHPYRQALEHYFSARSQCLMWTKRARCRAPCSTPAPRSSSPPCRGFGSRRPRGATSTRRAAA